MIGFYRAAFLGDNAIALRALCALRKLYQGDIIIYTNTQGFLLFSTLEGFICIDTSSMDASALLAHINAQHFTHFLLTQPNRWRCALLSKSNAKHIISFATCANIFNPRIKKVFFSRALSRKPYYKALLSLVRSVNPTLYDNLHLNSTPCIYPIDTQARAYVLDALRNASSMIIFTNQSSPHTSHALDSLATSAMPYIDTKAHMSLDTTSLKLDSTHTPIICINPFALSSPINLPLFSYITLARTIATRYPNARICLLSYKNTPHEPSKLTLKDIYNDSPPLHNLTIIENNNNLANLIELLRLSTLLISPSTGTIHLADMLHIPTIGIYNHKDARLWLGASMSKSQLLLINTPLHKLTPAQIARAEHDLIALALHTLHRLLPHHV